MTGFRNLMTGAAGAAGAGGFAVDNSVVFNDDDSQYLIRENASNSTTGGSDARKKFTVSLWWKHGNIPSGGQNLFIQRNSSANYMKCAIAGSGGNEGALQFFGVTLGAFSTGDTSAVLRDPHAWYHILFYYDSTDSTAGDRARIYLNGVRITDFQTSATNPSSGAITQFGSNNAQVIGQNQGASGYSDGYMAEMVVIDGQALTPSSFTEFDNNGVLRPLDISKQSFTFGDQGFYLPFTSSTLLGEDYGNSSGLVDRTSGTLTGDFTQNGGNAAAFDGNYAQASGSAARKGGGTSTAFLMKDHGSGVTKTITGFRVFGCTDQGFHSDNDSDTVEVKLQGSANGTDFTDLGTLSFTDPGNASPQGKFTGITTSTAYRYHKLLFTFDTATGGKLVGEAELYEGSNPSGGNNFTAVNSPTQTTDSPTTNAATFSPLITRHQTSFNGVASDWTFTNGNRTLTHTSGSSGDIMAAASQLLQPGQKYHFEAVTESMHSSAYARFQLALVPQSMWETDASPLTGTNDQFTFSLIKSGGTGSNTAAFDNGSLTAPTNKPTTNSRLTFEVDMSTIGSTTVRYYFNGSLDTTYSSLGFADEPYYVVSFTGTETDRNGVFNFNFGSSDFTDTPTTGHTGLTAKDAFAASAPAIEDGSAHFQATAYSGTGSAREVDQSGNSQFQPDLVWVKKRNGTNEHRLVDAVRGATKTLFSDGNAGESTESTGVTGFDSDGFSVGTGGGYNNSSGTYVGWQWLAGGSGSTVSGGMTKASDSSTTDITRSVNTTNGLSIITYTGNGSTSTIQHGLGNTPKWILIKRLNTAQNWLVYHAGVGASATLVLNETGTPSSSDAAGINSTAPTSSVFTVSNDITNENSSTYVAYCWAEISGFSKFGAFTSGSSGDPFVECGFTPALIFLKRTSSADAWYVQDTTRDPNNPAYRYLQWDSSAAEASNSSVYIDIISNGFVCDLGSIVTANNDMVFGAFAEHPFAGTTPATAR